MGGARGVPVKYRITFKAHRNSDRIYTLVTEDKATAHFTVAALAAAFWFVIGIEEFE